jgi:hypothetical protein
MQAPLPQASLRILTLQILSHQTQHAGSTVLNAMIEISPHLCAHAARFRESHYEYYSGCGVKTHLGSHGVVAVLRQV